MAASFPTLEATGVAYLDSGATSQTPQPVIDAMDDYYGRHRGTVHRSVYALAAEATELTMLFSRIVNSFLRKLGTRLCAVENRA